MPALWCENEKRSGGDFEDNRVRAVWKAKELVGLRGSERMNKAMEILCDWYRTKNREEMEKWKKMAWKSGARGKHSGKGNRKIENTLLMDVGHFPGA